MYDTSQAFALAHRPMTIVISPKGSVGIITEVNINNGQDQLKHQLSYSIEWLYNTKGDDLHNSWWSHDEIKIIGKNLFDVIAKCMCHPMGRNRHHVEQLLGAKK